MHNRTVSEHKTLPAPPNPRAFVADVQSDTPRRPYQVAWAVWFDAAQVCAAGALLNILGPDLGEDAAAGGNPNRKGFAKLLSSAIVLGAMYETLFEHSARETMLA
jgi:hypothetical protein